MSITTTTTTPPRLLTLIFKLFALTAAMFIVPTLIHRGVQSIDDVYELLGRRARSPYTSISWMSVGVAVLVVLGWHVWLGQLSYRVVLEDVDERNGSTEGKRISWGRILGRIVIPVLLIGFAVSFVCAVLGRFASPAPFITANTVDGDEVRGSEGGVR